MKIEAVITVWDDGIFKMRDRIEADSIESLEAQLEFTIDNMKQKLEKIEKKKYAIADDDDIPF